jgi:hypothetical protein
LPGILKSRTVLRCPSQRQSMLQCLLQPLKIKFVTSLLGEVLGKPPPLPRLLREDNTGAIFMAKNIYAGQRIKHADTPTFFTNDMVQNGVLKVLCICSADNPADGMTKNLSSALH